MADVRVRKLFRESHRENRLRPLRLGESFDESVRPLSLTLTLQKLISIKDFTARIPHEKSIALPHHAPSLS
jgi:hypothetical protein